MPDRDAEFNLTAHDKTGPAARSAADGFEKVSDKADKAQRSIDELGDETGHLSRKMLETRAAAVALARQFDKTGDHKILKDFTKINNEAAKLGRVMRAIKFDAPDIKAPKGLLGGFVNFAKQAGLIGGDVAVEGFTDAFKALPGPVKTAVVAAVVGAAAAAAPIVAGALEGAVVGGIAVGGIAAGLILASKDPRVVASYGKLGQDIYKQLQVAATPITEQVLGAAPKLGAAFQAEDARIQRIFKGLSTVIGPILDNVIEAAHKIMPSIERASAVGGRILKDLSAQLPALAGDIGDLLDAFSAGGPGAAAALGLIIFQLRGLISLLAFGAQASAPFLNMFGKLVELTNLVPKSGEQVSQLSGPLMSSASAAQMAAISYGALAYSMQNTANQAQAMQDAFNRLFGEEMGVQQANLAVNVGYLQLTETLKNNKKTLDQHTEAGQQNAAVILQQISNLDAKRQADIAAGNGTAEATAKANAAYQSQVGALRALLIQLGFTAAEVDNLIGRLYAIPSTITTTVTTVYRKVGSPPGTSDQATGHSRTGSEDYGGADGWYVAQFAGRGAAAFAEHASSSAPRTPPMEITSNLDLTVELDGVPFRNLARRTTRAAEQRQAWRAHVGSR